LRQIVNDDRWRARVRDRFFTSSSWGTTEAWKPALDPANLFPKAGRRTQEELRRWLEDLVSYESSRRAAALNEFSGKVELLIEAAQLEVINEDLPSVIVDAVSEQAEWNIFKVAQPMNGASSDSDTRTEAARAQANDRTSTASPTAPASPFVFLRGPGRFDPFFATLSAEEHMRRAMETFEDGASAPPNPKETRLGNFFVQSYTIAKERLLQHVPQPVLLELLATGLLVFRNCVLNLPYMGKIKRHPFYIFGADLPLRAFYAAALLLRRAPQWVLATYISVASLCILSLLIAYFWHDALWQSSNRIQRFLILAGLPTVVLVVEMLLLIFTSRLFQKNTSNRSS
jgi:hypothetical protein